MTHPNRSKAPTQRCVGAFAPTDRVEGVGRQRMSQILDRFRLTQLSPTRHYRRTPLAAVALWRQWFTARRPDHHRRLDPDNLGQSQICQSLTKRLIDPVTSIGQHTVFRRPLGQQCFQLPQGDLGLGGELNLGRNPSLLAQYFVFRPLPRQVQLIRDRRIKKDRNPFGEYV